MTGIHYPLFSFEKDDCSMRMVETPDRILYHFEAIDIENHEYVFWDASGQGISIAIKDKVPLVAPCKAAFPIQDAFLSYLESLNMQVNLVEGSAVDIWDRIKGELEKRPRKRFWISRLFFMIMD